MVAIFFVVDGLTLEAQAALLAATLRHHNGTAHRYLGYVPAAHIPNLGPAFVSLMQRCGVELRRLPDGSRPWYKPYPHGNKLLAALDRRGSSHSMFLDSDILCLAPLDLSPPMLADAVTVVPEGRRSWGKDLERWERVYARFGLPLPQERITLSRARTMRFVPYFNAGMALFPEARLPHGRRFAEAWYDTALEIDHDVPVAKKRPWLDQIALPVTLKRFGLNYHLADEAYNFAASDRVLKPGEAPILLHYHRFGHLATWPNQRQAALDQTRAIAGPGLFSDLQAIYGHLWAAAPIQSGPVAPTLPQVP